MKLLTFSDPQQVQCVIRQQNNLRDPAVTGEISSTNSRNSTATLDRFTLGNRIPAFCQTAETAHVLKDYENAAVSNIFRAPISKDNFNQ